MWNKILFIIWFILRPKYYQHLVSVIIRKFYINYDTNINKKKAHKWADANSVPYLDALEKLGLNRDKVGLDNDSIIEGQKLQLKSSVKMGGASHVHLIYDCVRLTKAEKVIETGVAYGWSSLAILKALNVNKNAMLYSVDMPYPRKKNENDVGIVVPQYLRKNWILIRKPDKPGIVKALNKAGGQIDLCHYDSDKSWWGRNYAYPILWKSLKSKGLFITDDIQDNLYFSEFVKNKSSTYTVVKYDKKYIGLILKP